MGDLAVAGRNASSTAPSLPRRLPAITLMVFDTRARGRVRKRGERDRAAVQGREEAVQVTWAQILPLAFVMIAGPQIITSFFLATSREWAKASLAFIGGAAIGIATLVTIAYVVGANVKSSGSKHTGTADHVIDSIVLALLLFLAVRAFLKRHESEPPKWMSGLEKERPKGAFLLGLALLSIFPTEIASNIAAGLHISRHDAPWWQCLPFVGLTLLLLAIPSLMVVLLGDRANKVLPKMRDWMNQNSWIVSEIVLAFLVAITVKSLVS